ncbi:uncharacterized protein LOC119554384 [Drosophila subpulchrella]|uniref:uncharacterized protein LOC119554384 n=1 Tax=Drosophila subpulchrella TaxID=1486046 RepID=UPI0018A1758B|nr:uncharacterized protein LOC119554384 [Drosophila subpulchrella]
MANLFSSMLPSGIYQESSDIRDSSSSSGDLLIPDVDLIASMMPHLYPVPDLQTHRRHDSTLSNFEGSPLSDDEKRERIRLHEMLNQYSDPIEF